MDFFVRISHICCWNFGAFEKTEFVGSLSCWAYWSSKTINCLTAPVTYRRIMVTPCLRQHCFCCKVLLATPPLWSKRWNCDNTFLLQGFHGYTTVAVKELQVSRVLWLPRHRRCKPSYLFILRKDIEPLLWILISCWLLNNKQGEKT